MRAAIPPPPPEPAQPARPAPEYPDPIPGIIPFGTVTLLGGAPAVGKSTLLAQWCVAWRDSLPINGKPTNKPTALYYLAADRSWPSYAHIFAKVGFPDIPHYSLVDDATLKLSDLSQVHKAHELFERCLVKLDPIPGAHVLVDPISPLFINGNPNLQRDVARSMLGFSRVCRERQLNLTCTVHFGKQKQDSRERYTRPQDRIAGSTSFAGFSHTQIYICDPELPKQPYYLMGWNPRETAPESFNLARDERGLFVPYDEGDRTDKTVEEVLACFPPAGEQITLGPLVIEAKVRFNHSRATTCRAIEALIKGRRVLRFGRGRYGQVKPS